MSHSIVDKMLSNHPITIQNKLYQKAANLSVFSDQRVKIAQSRNLLNSQLPIPKMKSINY